MQNNKNNATLYILIILAIIIWGGTWTSAKLVANEVPSNVLIFWRFLITFISFLPVVFFSKISLKLNIKSFMIILLASIFMVAYNLLFFQGLKTGYAGAGSVIVTTLNPIFIYVLSVIFFKNKFGKKEIIGLFIGLIGGVVLIRIWEVSYADLMLSGNLLFIIAASCWASMTVTSQYSNRFMHPFAFSLYVYAISTILIFPFSFNKGVFNFSSFSAKFWINILFLSLIATTFAVTVYFYCTTKLGAHITGSFMFCVPVSAILLSWLIIGEKPRIPTIIGGLIAVSAVYLINYKSKSKKSDNESLGVSE